jgi:hypothetical protein
MLLPRDALDNRPRRIRARAVAAIAVSSAWRLTLIQSCSEQSKRRGGGPVSNRKIGLYESPSMSAE